MRFVQERAEAKAIAGGEQIERAPNSSVFTHDVSRAAAEQVRQLVELLRRRIAQGADVHSASCGRRFFSSKIVGAAREFSFFP